MAIYLKRFKTHEEEIQNLCKNNIIAQPVPLVTFTDDCEEVRYPKGFNKEEETFQDISFVKQEDNHTMIYDWTSDRKQFFNQRQMAINFCGEFVPMMGGQPKFVSNGLCEGKTINDNQFVKVVYDDENGKHFEVLTENGVYEDDNLYVKLERTLKEERESATVSGGGIINPGTGGGGIINPGVGGGVGPHSFYYYYTNLIKFTITFKNEEIEKAETKATLQFFTAENQEDIIDCE